MFLYMFAFQLTSVVEQDLFVKKACLANLNYTADICYNLSNHTEINKEVQVSFLLQNAICYNIHGVLLFNLTLFNSLNHIQLQITVSNFQQWNHIAGNIFTIVIALFIGSWSDRRGRKIPLLIGLTGNLIYVLGLLLNIHYGNACFFFSMNLTRLNSF